MRKMWYNNLIIFSLLRYSYGMSYFEYSQIKDYYIAKNVGKIIEIFYLRIFLLW